LPGLRSGGHIDASIWSSCSPMTGAAENSGDHRLGVRRGRGVAHLGGQREGGRWGGGRTRRRRGDLGVTAARGDRVRREGGAREQSEGIESQRLTLTCTTGFLTGFSCGT
jgi:hypothetical protein